jgi:hypothetical protein
LPSLLSKVAKVDMTISIVRKILKTLHIFTTSCILFSILMSSLVVTCCTTKQSPCRSTLRRIRRDQHGLSQEPVSCYPSWPSLAPFFSSPSEPSPSALVSRVLLSSPSFNCPSFPAIVPDHVPCMFQGHGGGHLIEQQL